MLLAWGMEQGAGRAEKELINRAGSQPQGGNSQLSFH